MSRRGPAFAITDEWRRVVLARMAERRVNKAGLARALNCSRTAITDVLTDGPSSALVPEIERLLDLQVSTQTTDPATHEIIQTVGPTGQRLRLPADRKLDGVAPLVVGDEVSASREIAVMKAIADLDEDSRSRVLVWANSRVW